MKFYGLHDNITISKIYLVNAFHFRMAIKAMHQSAITMGDRTLFGNMEKVNKLCQLTLSTI